MTSRTTTNTLLLILVIPFILYLLKLLSFIFIPLVLSGFIAILFLPLMRWLKRRKVPKPFGIIIVVLIIIGVLKLGGIMIELTSAEIISSQDQFLTRANTKIITLIESIERFFGIVRLDKKHVLLHYFEDHNVFDNVSRSLEFVVNTLSGTLMTAFFVILLLSGSIDIERLMKNTFFKTSFSSIKTFIKIEKDIIKFIKVKFVISLLTGIGFSLACLLFGVSFPLFWGLFAFLINFVQMIGSVISVVALSLFAFVEIDPTGTLLFFILTITAVQALFGGVVEPIFMGKTFSVNIIVVLLMLMLWGYVWGIPGLIMSIPITVVIKLILEQFPKTKFVGIVLDGNNSSDKAAGDD